MRSLRVSPSSSSLEKAELFDHATITFTSTGSMVHPRWSHSAVLLSSGKVLVAGGSDSSGALISAELFDPATGSFEATGDLLEPRSGATGTLLVSGKVLIAGGTGGSGQVLATAELYDPITGTFSETGRMTSARSRHTATFLASGKVLLVGGRKDITPASAVSTAELFDPSRNAFVATGPMATARANHTATLLPDGKVLVLGGAPSDRVSLSSGESYDPGTGTFNAASHLEEQRDSHTATLLPSGKVLVAGGGMQLYDTEAPHGPHFFITSFTAELSEANSGGFIFTGSLETGRSGHSATLLGNGAVLVTGGTGYGGNALATAEMYQ